MEKIYYDPSQPGSFGGVKRLTNRTKTTDVSARRWLATQDSYTIHRDARKKFRRRKTYAVGIDHLWQADLVDLSSLARYNDKNRFLLTCIDCFSRFAFAVPLRNKSAIETRNAFDTIIRTNGRRPVFLQTDKGREFVNGIFQSYLSENNIHFYTSENDDIKCSLVERFNRTLKERMWRYFTYIRNYRYVEVLNDMVNAYNSSHHRSIGMAPSDVTPSNESLVYSRLYKAKTSRNKWKFEIGDKVRISENKVVFKKGYVSRWSKEIFEICNRMPTDPITYEIKDYNDELVKGKFYEQELQKITKEDDIYRVEKILKTRKHLGKTEYLVRWEGYPVSFDSWVDYIN